MTLKDYSRLIIDKRCRWCKRRLPKRVKGYDHPDGYPVDGFAAPQWLYVECPNRSCGYMWSLRKLGIAKRVA